VTRRGLLGASPLAVGLPTAALAVDLKDFGAKEGDDIGPVLTRALAEAPGLPLNLGPGEYRLASRLVYINRERPGASRAPGLVLRGAGSQRTIIRCTGAGDAGLEIGQEIPYRFSVAGHLEGFTLQGVPSAPPQDGLRLSGAWNYTLSDVWITDFSGNGVSLPWRDDLRWQLGDFETTAGSKLARRFAKGGFHEDMRIWGGVRIFGPGLEPGTTVGRIIDETTLEMSAPAKESGARTIEITGNSDAFTSIIHVSECAFSRNRGWGLHAGAGQAVIMSWLRSEADQNGTGGVFCGGNGWSFDGGSIGGNTGVGLLVDRVGGGPLNLRVERIEFDSNVGSHVWLKEINTAKFERCRFISHFEPTTRKNRPEIGFVIGNSPATRVVRNLELIGCQFRAPPDGKENYAGIRFGAPGGYQHVEIIDPAWVAKAPQHVLLESEPAAGAHVRVQENGFTRYADRTPRAWAIMERGAAQKLAARAAIELFFDRLQGNLAGGATPQEYRVARATAQSDWLAMPTTAGLRPGLPVSAGRLGIDGRILAVEKDRIRISAAARSDGELRLLVGGLSVPYAQLYEVDALIGVEGAAPGSTLELALTVDGSVTRRAIVPAGPVPRQTLSLRVLLPLPSTARVGLRLSHDGEREIAALAGPLGGSLSIIAAA
jgi:hypothetical protein